MGCLSHVPINNIIGTHGLKNHIITIREKRQLHNLITVAFREERPAGDLIPTRHKQNKG